MTHFNAESLAFGVCLSTVFIDVMGQQFLAPVLVPYALSLDATITETSLLFTVEFAFLMLSQFVMSWLADTKGRRPVGAKKCRTWTINVPPECFKKMREQKAVLKTVLSP